MRAKTLISISLGLWAVGGSIALVHCVGDETATQNDGGKDGATDTGNDVTQPPDAGFTLSLAPGHVTEDPGDNFPVTINVNRAPSFTDPVTFVVTPPPGFTTTQPAPAGNSSLFYVATNADAGTGDYDITVTGSSTTLVQNVKLGVHVGSVLPIGDGGAVVIPSYASVVEVKAWGGGGGAASGGCAANLDGGGAGGPGGFVSAFVPVDPGQTYTAFVGGGGTFDPTCEGLGGSGGGYSGFFAPDGGPLLIAGGGGGGSSVYFCGGSCGWGTGGSGGQGGGESGGFGVSNACYAWPGAPDGGGWSPCGGQNGAYLQGGAGVSVSSTAVGGKPGGGNGGTHAGGGGGGYFGGGGGGQYLQSQPYTAGSGGGGNGWNPFDGGVNIMSDSGAAPNASDPDYANGAGSAGFKVAGGNGRVIIRLPKP